MKKIFLTLAVFVMAICANAQTNQYFWYQGNLMMGNPIAQIDSVTFGEGEPADTLHIMLPRTIIKTVHDTLYITVHDTVCPGNIPEGALAGEFSVSATKKIRFSKGNLQYQASTKTWRFAENQYDYVGDATLGNVYENGIKCNNASISTTYSGWVDLFGFSTSKTNYGISSSQNNTDYAGSFVDWGLTMGDAWRTLTKTEWEYLINGRINHTGLIFFVCVEGVKGMLLLPDDYLSDSENIISNKKQYSQQDFSELANKGAVFLPANGYRDGKQVKTLQTVGEYYANTGHLNNLVDGLQFYYNSNYVFTDNNNNRYDGRGVRLVQDVK